MVVAYINQLGVIVAYKSTHYTPKIDWVYLVTCEIEDCIWRLLLKRNPNQPKVMWDWMQGNSEQV